MKQNKTNKLKEEEILKNPQYEPFVGNNYRNGIESKKGNLKILFLGDSNNYWAEYKEQNEGVSQGKSYCEYLMTETHENKINDLKKKILEGVNNKLKDIKDSVDVDDIAYYNLRIANEDDIPITNETLKKGNLKCYCNVLLKRIEELKPNVVFGEQNLVTQLKLRAVSKWKEIEQALNKKVKLKYESCSIIPISFKDNGLERINSNRFSLDKLDFIHFILENDIDFLWRHCIFSPLKKQSKKMLKHFGKLDKKSSLKDSNFDFLKKYNSIEVPREEYIKAYKCIHDIQSKLKEFRNEIEYMQKNSEKKISSEYNMKNKVKQLIKMLTFLELTNQYIYIGLVPQFTRFIDKKIPFNTEEEWENNKNNLAREFLKKNKDQNDGRGVSTLLRAIVEKLKEEGDNVSLERMHRIFTSPKLKRIYKSEEIDKLKLQIQSYNPN